MEFSMYRGNPKNSALESAQDWKFRWGNEKTKTNKTFASILKLYLTFFTDKSLGKNTIIQGYRNRYNVIDHGHKKILLCIF